MDMKARRISLIAVTLVAVLAFPKWVAAQDQVARGEYLFNTAGCAGCHTDSKNNGALLAGGRELKTPFGTYYGPNITADPTHGIGTWSDEDFIRALRDGVSPDGSHYFPVFPYTSFTKMTDADMRALKAYIFSLPPVAKPDIPHDIDFPFGFRFTMFFWKLLFFDKGPYTPPPGATPEVARGGYIAEALAHCGECHTPRNMLGAVDQSQKFAGLAHGPDGDTVPNITSHDKTGIGNWTDDEMITLFRDGEMPLGDEVDGGMAEVVRNGTSKLTEQDLTALIAYLRSVSPIENDVFHTH